MAVWECGACGYLYDEKAEGTKWEDLPDDWVCPVSKVVDAILPGLWC